MGKILRPAVVCMHYSRTMITSRRYHPGTPPASLLVGTAVVGPTINIRLLANTQEEEKDDCETGQRTRLPTYNNNTYVQHTCKGGRLEAQQ